MALTLRLDESENRLLEVIKKKHNDKYEYSPRMHINTNSGIIKHIIRNFLNLNEELEEARKKEVESTEKLESLTREVRYKNSLQKEIKDRDKIIQSYLEELD